ncbi:MAG: right-handed parallel beta-helix repeat-containing protein [Proteobacteria bacterium]|nr:right-handed parallel beta-helix repeat-containing protein [Pseudomonadota bacterium]
MRPPSSGELGLPAAEAGVLRDAQIDAGRDARVDAYRPDLRRDASPPDRPAVLADGGPDGPSASALFVAAQTGDDVGGDGSRAAPWRTITHALLQRKTEPELVVLAGTYRECVVVNQGHQRMILRGEDAAATVIDGSGCVHTVWVQTGVDASVVVKGFTIRGGNGVDSCGGGLRIEDEASPLIEGNIVRDNFATTGGGVCIGERSAAQLRGNQLLENHSRYGGAGLFLDRASTATVEGNLIGENINSEYWGGGVACKHCQAVLRGNTIRGNRTGAGSVGHGGGLSCDEGAPTVQNNLILGNSATAYYAGGNAGGHGAESSSAASSTPRRRRSPITPSSTTPPTLAAGSPSAPRTASTTAPQPYCRATSSRAIAAAWLGRGARGSMSVTPPTTARSSTTT